MLVAAEVVALVGQIVMCYLLPNLSHQNHTHMCKFTRIFGLSIFLITGGCASIDFDYPRTESFAFTDTADTYLARQLADDVARRPADQSGFLAVPDAIDSLALRLLLAERAERSIDAQYFLIHDDLVGKAFIRQLLRAANRGVRVRLLIDDSQLSGYDKGLAALDAHDNFDVRIFNPFANRQVRALDAFRFDQITRRMHNKSFTVDNQITLIGGRNIADEYFGARSDEIFTDLDVLAIGPIVPQVSTMFDSYWNHATSLPITAFANAPKDSDQALAALDDRLTEAMKDIEASRYAEALRGSILSYVEADESVFSWARYDLVFDSPDKVVPKEADASASIMTKMRDSIGQVEDEMFVVTPYFVLTKDNIDAFRALRDRDIKVTVVTNSLASNNHTISHSGYIPVRKPLLEMGVELYEIRARTDLPADETRGVQTGKTALHAKTFAVDREKIFIGSFNWNQRSAIRDTELGVVIYSPELATRLVENVSAAFQDRTFQVYLNEGGKLRWKGFDDGKEVILDKEPQSGFWRRVNANTLRWAPIKGQL
jgi:putative cardiolipin synthase